MSSRTRNYPEILRVVAAALRSTAPDSPDARTTALLRELFGTDMAGAGDVDLRGTASRRWADIPVPIDLNPYSFHKVATEHPFSRAYRRAGTTIPLRLSDVVSHCEDLSWGEAALDFPLATPTMAIPLAVTTRHICIVAMLRRGRDFSAQELRLAQELQPVLSGVYALRWQAAARPGSRSDPFTDPDTDISLTARELAVLDLMTDGLIAVAIARQLGISARTVGKHIENIYRKLGTHDRTSAVLRAQALGFLPPYIR